MSPWHSRDPLMDYQYKTNTKEEYKTTTINGMKKLCSKDRGRERCRQFIENTALLVLGCAPRVLELRHYALSSIDKAVSI